MFDHRQRHPEKVRFLEGALADHRLRHLAGDGDQRHRIHVSIGNGRDEVGGAGAAGGHANAGLAGGAGISFRGEGAALLVARQNRANAFGMGQSLMDFHAGSAGIGENRVNAFLFERARTKTWRPIMGV